MVVSVLAASASAWGVLMGLSPVLQIRRMLRERSSREVSLGYFAILLAGFVLWISYGIRRQHVAGRPEQHRPAGRAHADGRRASPPLLTTAIRGRPPLSR